MKKENPKNAVYMNVADLGYKYVPNKFIQAKLGFIAIREKITEAACTITYDVGTNGNTINHKAVNCHKALKKESIKTIKKYRYKPIIKDGKSVIITGLKRKFTVST